jgi:hypothetical protein
MRGGSAPTGMESSSGVAAATFQTDPRDACFALGSTFALDFSRVRRFRRFGLGLRSPPVDLTIDPAF